MGKVSELEMLAKALEISKLLYGYGRMTPAQWVLCLDTAEEYFRLEGRELLHAEDEVPE